MFTKEILSKKGFVEDGKGGYMPVQKAAAPITALQPDTDHEVVSEGLDRFWDEIRSGLKVYAFDIEPMGKPRMTQSDKWKKRDCVVRYWEFADKLRGEAERQGLELGDVLIVEFHLTCPASWSKKKQQEMWGKPHQSKPDTDNLLKAASDILKKDDKGIHQIVARKLWGIKGQVVIYQ